MSPSKLVGLLAMLRVTRDCMAVIQKFDEPSNRRRPWAIAGDILR